MLNLKSKMDLLTVQYDMLAIKFSILEEKVNQYEKNIKKTTLNNLHVLRP